MFLEKGKRGGQDGTYFQLQPEPPGGGVAEVKTVENCCEEAPKILSHAITPHDTKTDPVVLFIPDTQPDLQAKLMDTMETFGHPVEAKHFDIPAEVPLPV